MFVFSLTCRNKGKMLENAEFQHELNVENSVESVGNSHEKIIFRKTYVN